MTSVMCPGSFDPPTNGHVDIIGRCAAAFDRVVVAVVSNPSKNPMFTLAERIDLLQAACAEADNVEFVVFDGLLVDFAKRQNVDAVLKGIRGEGDIGYEIQMSQMNQHLSGMETILMASSPEWSFVSSSLVREVAKLGGDVSALVPPAVAVALRRGH